MKSASATDYPSRVETHEFWGKQTLSPGQSIHWESGTARIWAERASGATHEWRIHSERGPVETHAARRSGETPPPEKPSWKRWAFREEDSAVWCLPVMPDKPVVVRPDVPLTIPRGNEVTFFVSIPVWLRFSIGRLGELAIHDEPTVVLSKTWAGEPTAGELCYALRTSGSRILGGIKKGAHRAVCPLVIRNRAEEELVFQKLCLRTIHSNIHLGATRLWCEQIEVNYLGKAHFSEFVFSQKPPAFEPVRGVLGEAREPVHRNLLRKSIESFWTS